MIAHPSTPKCGKGKVGNFLYTRVPIQYTELNPSSPSPVPNPTPPPTYTSGLGNSPSPLRLERERVRVRKDM